MEILFINGSGNGHGKTASLAHQLLKGKDYQTLNLVDYKIYGYGQSFEDDQLDDVIAHIKQASTIIIGSPVYWHNMSGLVRNLLDRLYDVLDHQELFNKQLYFIFQGAAPEQWMLESGEYTMKRFASLYGMTYKGMITNQRDLQQYHW